MTAVPAQPAGRGHRSAPRRSPAGRPRTTRRPWPCRTGSAATVGSATPSSSAAGRAWTCSPTSSPTTGSATASSSRPPWPRWVGRSASRRGSSSASCDGTSQPDGRILYTSDDRHAWPEMYFAGVGWVRFEPTPGSAPARRPPGRGRTSTPAPARGRPEHHGRGARPDPDAQAPTPQDLKGNGSGALGAVVAGRRPRRAGAGRASARASYAASSVGDGSPPHDPVHLAEGAWAELRATALDLGLDWPEQRSPREQARSVVGQVPGAQTEAVASLEGLLVQVERGRYGRAGERSPRSTRRCAHARSETVESWRKAMLGSVDRERGWRGRLWPMSLVRGR